MRSSTLTSLLLLLSAILLISTSIVTARPLSEEEKKERKAKADEANKKIRFLQKSELTDKVKEGVWLVMFGATWCPFTQKATPKWLQFQDAFDAKYDPKSTTFNIAKVECSDDEGAVF
ncbi:hypothetical protein HDU97_006772 [Phlyctochytrium planicorne]|nr:hypothetical protein HDU97_006772 [Phlyctochytrium planicorne]